MTATAPMAASEMLGLWQQNTTANDPRQSVNRSGRIVMRRTTFVLGLISSAVAVALIAVIYGIASHRSPTTVEPSRGEANQAQQTSSIDAEVNDSTAVVSRRSLGGDQNPTVAKAPRRTSYVDEATDRKMVREESTRDVANWYSLLLEQLDLPPREKDALISFLIEDLIARTRTRYASGIGMDEHERSNRIAAIIGDSKLQQFLALEHNLSEYREVQKVQSMLQQNDIPLSDTERDGLLEILVDVREQDRVMPGADAKRRTIESLQHTLDQMDEYERLVLELAPSVLSAKQVEYLFERYQALSYRRANALEHQRKARANNPDENLPLWYPPRD